MKIASPLFVVALGVAVLASWAEAACSSTCTDAECKSLAIDAGSSEPISVPGDLTDCPVSGQKRYIRTLTVIETGGLGITVSFKQGASGAVVTKTATTTANDGTNAAVVCSYSYVDVGLSDILTDDVIPTVTCPGASGGTACAVKYKATYGCAKTACAKKSPAVGSTSAPITIGGSASISVPAGSAACPYGMKRFLSALEVSEDAGLGIAVAFKHGTTTTGIDGVTPVDDGMDNADPQGTDKCYFSYSIVGQDLAKAGTLTGDMAATVTCANTAAACNIKHKATFACPTAGITCPADATLTSVTTVAPSGGFVVPSSSITCPAGQVKYLKSLDVRGTGGITVAFNNGLSPSPVATGPTSGSMCALYQDVMGPKTTATDVEAKLTCTANAAATCDMKYKAVWACSTPIVYTRTNAVGDGCVKDLSDCANRCAKSYQLFTSSVTTAATASAAASTTTTMKLKPQLTTGCTCTDVTATVTSTSGDPSAANTDTKIKVDIQETQNTMTVASTDDANVCTLTYSRVAFANQYIEKPYTRTTPGTDAKCTPDTATASADDLCAFKCAAEISLTKPVTDSIRVTKAAVTGCNCGDPADMVVDGDGATAGTDALKYTYDKATGILTVTTTTGSDDTNDKLVCSAVYKESCSKLCTDGACGVNDIPAGGLALNNLDGCPAYTFSYPKSVIVRGLLAENDVSVKSATAVVDKTAVKCYKTYGQLGGTVTAISADVTPTVACGTDGCKAAVKTEWGCTAPKCPTVTGLSTKVTMTVPNATGMVVPGPATACGTGLKAYIKTLDIRTAAGKDVVVKFNNGLTPSPSSKGTTCTFYSDVIGLTATSTDVTATINCASTTAADTCDVQYKVEYGCYKPAAATVYTRKGAPDGRGCVTDLSTCASRCAKSYQLIATETEKMLVPQITPDGCYCPALTATTDTTTTTKATNTATTMEVNDGTTMTVEYTAPGKECKTTFAKAAFANSFVAETYARGAVTPATCVPAADADAATTCAYKCAAELSIKPLGGDALNVTQAVVTSPADCTCDPFMAYVDVDGLTASGPLKTSSVEIKQTTGALTVKTTTGSTVCTASYAKKTAPPPPATTTPSPTTTAPPPATTAKTGTSAGVSALGAGADAGMVTVTLVAAAAGVQAVGLPA